MLRFLDIRNLAVIEAVAIEFQPGLNILTGETGAGKSILVGALGLLLGGRSSPDLVRTGAEAAEVQAVFETPEGLELILRREVTAAGRSRAFLDGRLVPASALREAASQLVDLHGQHEHQALLDPEIHLDLLDQFAGAAEDRARVAESFARWRVADADLAAARRLEEQRAARTEILEFQLAEMDRVAPRPGEDEELGALRALLASAERVRRLADESYALLYDHDEAALARLGQVWRRIGELAGLDGRFSPFLEQKDGIKSQLEELAAFLRGYAASIDASPARLQEVEDRLALLERLKRKHGPTLDAVIERHQALRVELETLGSAGERIAEAERRVADETSAYLTAAALLSDARQAAAGRFARALERQLVDLAMAHTRFDVRFADGPTPQDRWSPRGTDVAEFYVSPNPGEELRPLARIVSGGEMSRVMLAIKNLASLDQPGKTLIFDEVDAGIGGRVADAVGRKLRRLGESFQVLCITHLPQIAAYGHGHYRIEKRVDGGRTTTRVDELDRRGREEELARMIGGERISPAARASARELLDIKSAAGVASASPERRRRVPPTTGNSSNGEGESEPPTKGESESLAPR